MKVELKGFIVSVHCPTEESLNIVADCTNLSPSRYMELVSKLQDVLTEMDLKHSKGDIKGRSLKARYRRIIAYNIRQRILRFFPYPSYYANKLKYVRMKVYQILDEYCFGIEIMKSGYFKEKVYILPENFVDGFLREISHLNVDVEETFKAISSIDISNVASILHSYGVEYRVKNVAVELVKIDLLPLELGRAIEEWSKRSPKVKEILEEKYRQLTDKIIEDIRRRLEDIFKGILGNAKIKKIRERLEQLRGMVESLGLNWISRDIVLPALEMIEEGRRMKDIDVMKRKLDELLSKLV